MLGDLLDVKVNQAGPCHFRVRLKEEKTRCVYGGILDPSNLHHFVSVQRFQGEEQICKEFKEISLNEVTIDHSHQNVKIKSMAFQLIEKLKPKKVKNTITQSSTQQSKISNRNDTNHFKQRNCIEETLINDDPDTEMHTDSVKTHNTADPSPNRNNKDDLSLPTETTSSVSSDESGIDSIRGVSQSKKADSMDDSTETDTNSVTKERDTIESTNPKPSSVPSIDEPMISPNTESVRGSTEIQEEKQANFISLCDTSSDGDDIDVDVNYANNNDNTTIQVKQEPNESSANDSKDEEKEEEEEEKEDEEMTNEQMIPTETDQASLPLITVESDLRPIDSVMDSNTNVAEILLSNQDRNEPDSIDDDNEEETSEITDDNRLEMDDGNESDYEGENESSMTEEQDNNNDSDVEMKTPPTPINQSNRSSTINDDRSWKKRIIPRYRMFNSQRTCMSSTVMLHRSRKRKHQRCFTQYPPHKRLKRIDFQRRRKKHQRRFPKMRLRSYQSHDLSEQSETEQDDSDSDGDGSSSVPSKPRMTAPVRQGLALHQFLHDCDIDENDHHTPVQIERRHPSSQQLDMSCTESCPPELSPGLASSDENNNNNNDYVRSSQERSVSGTDASSAVCSSNNGIKVKIPPTSVKTKKEAKKESNSVKPEVKVKDESALKGKLKEMAIWKCQLMTLGFTDHEVTTISETFNNNQGMIALFVTSDKVFDDPQFTKLSNLPRLKKSALIMIAKSWRMQLDLPP